MATLYIIIATTTTVLGDMAGFTGLVVIGGATCLFGEMHTTARFAWARKHSIHYVTDKQRATHRISIIGYILGGAALLVIFLTYSRIIGYTTGFIPLAVIIILKIDLNMTRNARLVPH
ncbi:MAG: hypothetical protein JRF50_15040 [Deltaproteobacteria bacterium]|nr:hypothetical protein [Deltaproteobacteria bacterium]